MPDATYFEMPPEAFDQSRLPEDARGKPVRMLEGEMINDEQVMQFDKAVVTLDGVYDLPMLGAEALDVEREYQRLTGGPTVTLTFLAGAFVQSEGGDLYQLQERLESPEMDAALRSIWEQMEKGDENIELGTDERKAAYVRLTQQRIGAPNKARVRPETCFIPAATLPDNCAWVLRVKHLLELQASVAKDSSPEPKEPSQRERTTYLNMIGGLVSLMLSNTPAGKPRSVYISQSAIIDALLVEFEGKPGIAKATLEAKFAEANRMLAAS